MHLFATTTASQLLELGPKAIKVETPSDWGSRLTGGVAVGAAS
jgi:hypothetical protein